MRFFADRVKLTCELTRTAAETTTEMMCDDGADVNGAHLLMRWTLV